MQHAKIATTLFYRPFPIFHTLYSLELFPIPILLSAYPYPFEHLPFPLPFHTWFCQNRRKLDNLGQKMVKIGYPPLTNCHEFKLLKKRQSFVSFDSWQCPLLSHLDFDFVDYNSTPPPHTTFTLPSSGPLCLTWDRPSQILFGLISLGVVGLNFARGVY